MKRRTRRRNPWHDKIKEKVVQIDFFQLVVGAVVGGIVYDVLKSAATKAAEKTGV